MKPNKKPAPKRLYTNATYKKTILKCFKKYNVNKFTRALLEAMCYKELKVTYKNGLVFCRELLEHIDSNKGDDGYLIIQRGRLGGVFIRSEFVKNNTYPWMCVNKK